MDVIGPLVSELETGADHVAIRRVRRFRGVLAGLGDKSFAAEFQAVGDAAGEPRALPASTAVQFERASETQPANFACRIHSRG